jgi:predicted DNA-binding transcriptional regulator AlpA
MEVISKDELLAELKIAARTLENWVRRGEFPRGVRIGRRMTWSRKALEQWRRRKYAFQTQFEGE